MTDRTNRAIDLLANAVDLSWGSNDEDVVLCLDYSGRFMYGQKCVSIMGRMNDCVRVLAKAATLNEDEFYELNLSDFRSDNMAGDVVWYWPDFDTSDMTCQCSRCEDTYED